MGILYKMKLTKNIKALENTSSSIRIQAVRNLGEMRDNQAVEPLINALRDEDEDVRVETAWALGKIGDNKAVEPLIQALKDKHVRQVVIGALGKIKDKRAVEPIARYLKSRNWDLRNDAVNALYEIGDASAVPSLQETLRKEDDDHVRKNIIRAFEEIALNTKDITAIEAMTDALKHPDTSNLAVRALHRLKWSPENIEQKIDYLIACGNIRGLSELGEKAIESVMQLLREPDEETRRWAAQALEEIGWKPKNDAQKAWYLMAKEEWAELKNLGYPALEPLMHACMGGYSDAREKAAETLESLEDPRVLDPLLKAFQSGNEKKFPIRQIALALGNIGDNKAVEPLIEVFQSAERYRYVKEYIAKALGKIGDNRAVEPLLKVFQSGGEDKYLTGKIALALGDIGDKRVVEPLPEAFQSTERELEEEDKVKEDIAIALGRIGDNRAVEPLIEALEDERGHIIEYAAYALGEIGDKRALKPLINILEKESTHERAWAAWALMKIGEPVGIQAVDKAWRKEDLCATFADWHFEGVVIGDAWQAAEEVGEQLTKWRREREKRKE